MDAKLLLFAALKLLVIPVAGLFLLKNFIHNDMLLGVCMVMVANKKKQQMED